MQKIILFTILTIFLFACDAAEDLITGRKAPEIISVESDKGWSVNPGDTVSITVNASNPEDGDLTYKWTVSAGSIIDGTYETTLIWKAPIVGGPYNIEIEVSNEYKSNTESVTVEVASHVNPYVNITSPIIGEYLIQHTTCKLKFDATHNNGIAQIYVFINDQVIDSLAGSQTITSYDYDWLITQNAGTTEIEIVAISNITALSGSDRVNVSIEGILPGKADD